MILTKKITILLHNGWVGGGAPIQSVTKTIFEDVSYEISDGYLLINKYDKLNHVEDFVTTVYSLSNIKEFKISNK